MTYVAVAIITIWALALADSFREIYMNTRAAARAALRAARERGEISAEDLARGLMSLEQPA